jgi:hypothetical protein
MGLLITFRLSGILRGPLTISENKTLDAASWSIERPAAIIHIGDLLRHVYNGDVSANYAIFIDDYHGNSWDYGGNDVINMQVNVTASIGKGFIHSANITFWEDYKNSFVNFFEDVAWPKQYAHVENLSIIRHKDWLIKPGLKAFVELAGLNNPKSVSFSCFVDWVLRSPQNYTHQLEVRFELVYFNGTAYNRLVQPFQLKIGPDDNNSFEKAEEIVAGKTYRFYIGPNDVDDYYKVYLNEGSTVSIRLKGIAPPALCDLELYDNNGKLAAYSNYDVSHNVTYTISSSGYWIIRVHQIENFGFYNLTLEAIPSRRKLNEETHLNNIIVYSRPTDSFYSLCMGD